MLPSGGSGKWGVDLCCSGVKMVVLERFGPRMTKMQSFSVLIPKDGGVFRAILPKAMVAIKRQMRIDCGKAGFLA